MLRKSVTPAAAARSPAIVAMKRKQRYMYIILNEMENLVRNLKVLEYYCLFDLNECFCSNQKTKIKNTTQTKI